MHSFFIFPWLWGKMLILRVERSRREDAAGSFSHYCRTATQDWCLLRAERLLSHIIAQQAHFLYSLAPCCVKAKLCAVPKSCRARKRRSTKRARVHVAGTRWIMLCCEYLVFHYKHIDGLKTDESCGSFLAPAKCGSPGFSHCKWVLAHKGRLPPLPGLGGPRLAPLAPWIRHSKPPFSIFPMRPGASWLYWSF